MGEPQISHTRIVGACGIVLAIGLACSLSVVPTAPPQASPTRAAVQSDTPVSVPTATPTPVDSPTTTPAPPTIQPTSTPTSTPAAPTPPHEFSYAIVDLYYYHEVVVEQAASGQWIYGIRFHIMGLAENRTDVALGTPRIYLVIYSGSEVIGYEGMGQSYGNSVLPGERAAFTNDVQPAYHNLAYLNDAGYDVQTLRFEVGLFADPIPERWNVIQYREMEVISVIEDVRTEGIYLEITVLNTGEYKVYPYLNFVAYDDRGRLLWAGIVFVATSIDDFTSMDALYPGTTGKRLLLFPAEMAEYELFLHADLRIEDE